MPPPLLENFMTRKNISHVLLIVSVFVVAIVAIFNLDLRNIYVAYALAIIASLVRWPIRFTKYSEQLTFVGQMPKLKDVFIYEIIVPVHETVGRRVTTRKLEIAGGGVRWSAMASVGSNLIDEFAPTEKEAIAQMMERIHKVK